MKRGYVPHDTPRGVVGNKMKLCSPRHTPTTYLNRPRRTSTTYSHDTLFSRTYTDFSTLAGHTPRAQRHTPPGIHDRGGVSWGYVLEPYVVENYVVKVRRGEQLHLCRGAYVVKVRRGEQQHLCRGAHVVKVRRGEQLHLCRGGTSLSYIVRNNCTYVVRIHREGMSWKHI